MTVHVHKLSVYVTKVPLGTKTVTVRQGRVEDTVNSSSLTGRGTYMKRARIARIKAAPTNVLAFRFNRFYIALPDSPCKNYSFACVRE